MYNSIQIFHEIFGVFFEEVMELVGDMVAKSCTTLLVLQQGHNILRKSDGIGESEGMQDVCQPSMQERQLSCGEGDRHSPHDEQMMN